MSKTNIDNKTGYIKGTDVNTRCQDSLKTIKYNKHTVPILSDNEWTQLLLNVSGHNTYSYIYYISKAIKAIKKYIRKHPLQYVAILDALAISILIGYI